MIHLKSENDVAILRMDDGKLNLIDTKLLDELVKSLQEAEDSDARAVVLTGTGGAFSAGVDLFKVVKGGKDYLDEFLPKLSAGLLKLFTFPKPVVAAINGHAIAGGCLLAWACDHTIMAAGSGRMGVVELAVGVPFPSLPLEIVRFVVPAQYFQEVVYTGATYEADAARQKGLLNEIVEPEKLPERALAIARRFAAIPADSFAATKRLMRQPALDRYERFRNTLDKETDKIWAAPATLDVIQAYLEKTVGKGKS